MAIAMCSSENRESGTFPLNNTHKVLKTENGTLHASDRLVVTHLIELEVSK